MVEYNLFWFIVLLIIGISFISLAIFYTFVAFGQDIDPEGYCLYNNTHPFNVLCTEQTIDSMCNIFYQTENWALYIKLECMLR